MRAIDPAKVRTSLPQAWLQSADDKARALKDLHDQLMSRPGTGEQAWRPALSEAVNQAAVWQDRSLRQALMDVSFGKCWYCEAHVAQRADNAVDHFRPKNRVAEDKTHPGYWWLACDWRNYRFACTFCNSARVTPDSSGGKQDHFPLWDEQKRVRTPEPLGREQPLLLDPIRPDNILCLTFDQDGKPAPTYSKERNLYQHSRAAASIEYFHLDRGELNRLRRDLMAVMQEHLLSAEQFARDLEGQNPTAEAAYSEAFATLLRYIQPNAEFSSAARAFLATRRGTSSVARELLEVGL